MHIYKANLIFSCRKIDRVLAFSKVKSNARIVPCNFTGQPNGEWIEAEAHIVNSNESEKANKLLKQKYDLQETTFPHTVEEVVISICQR